MTSTSDRNGSAFYRIHNGSPTTLFDLQLQTCDGFYIGHIGDGTSDAFSVEEGAFDIPKGCYAVWWWDGSVRGYKLGVDQ